MKLSDLIKALVDIATDYGECDTYFTTENETQLYNTVLIHPMPSRTTDTVFLKLEGITDTDKKGED